MVAQLPQVTHPYGIAFPSFNGHGQRLAAYSNLDDLLYIGDTQAIAGDPLPVNINLKVGLSDNAVGEHSRWLDARHLLQQALQLETK